ncbi:transmembrane channel-like protein 6 [Parambassis ranga]|uniref:Transmembrane channel-like protein n=1 Tax=Parambassis ranga TaxID=210632 RepID=A0A6P7IPN1_9TELE|nr:transmembrane channel-like protein 6 [Parambassis ranga]
MAHSENFAVNVSERDSDYENTEGGEPGQASFQFIDEPATSSKRCADIMEMEVLGKCKETPAGAANYWFGSKISGNNKEQLVADLRGFSVNDGMQRLRAMPLSLAHKKELRQLAFSAAGGSSLIKRNSSCYFHPVMCLSKTWHQCLLSSLSVLTSLHLWHSPMKRLSGRFGTAVLSYFLFLRTLWFFNLFLVVISGLFLILPQAIYPPPYHRHHNESHPHTLTGLEFLAGTGYLSRSLMFYGYYSAAHPPCNTQESQMTYCIPIAYFFNIIFTLFITCISLVHSMSKSFGRHFHVFKSSGHLAVLVYCSWDFKVTKKTSVTLQSEKISTQLKEQVSEMKRSEDKKSCMQRLHCLIVHAVAWTVCLSSISLTAMGVHHLSEATKKQDNKETELLLLSAVVAAINLSLPGLFNVCLHIEKYDSPVACVYVSIFRNLLLKVSVVGVLCHRWLGRIAVEPCWESFVGQELYRLLMMDFIFIVLYTVLGELLWRIFSPKSWRRNRKQAFDIAENVLDLIYGQTLTWFGVLVAPLLPAVQLIKLFVLFYIKKTSLKLSCQVPKKPWKATQMTTLFISLLCFPSFFGAAMFITYAMVMVKPSSECGPFRNLTTAFEIGQLWAQQLEKTNPNLYWLSWTYKVLVEKPLFTFLCAGVLLMVIYFHTQVVDGQRKVIGLLEKQLENEGKDKMFLITKLQTDCEQNSLVSPS